MKKPVSLFILVIAFCSAARAQKQAAGSTHPPIPRWSFELTAGPAIPIGQYAGYSEQNRNLAPVKTGGLLELSGTYHVNRSFGIILLANGQLNRVKDRPSDVHTTTQYIGPYVPTPYEDRWKIARLMAGGVCTLPLNKSRHFNLLARVLVGVQKTKTAGFTEGYVGDVNGYTPYNGSTLPLTFTYQGDIGFKWKPGGRLALIAYAGYNGSRPDYTVTYQEQNQTTGYSIPGPSLIALRHKTTLPTASLLFRSGIAWDL
jgi:hypothetical protein